MKKNTLLILLFFSIISYSQRKPDFSVALENTLKEVYFNSFSGIPVVQSNKELIGIDPYQNKVIWKQPMGSLGSLSAMSGDGETVVNNIERTPFIILENKTLLDTRNGNVLLKGSKIEGFQLLPDIYSVLVVTKAEKGEKSFSLVDMKSSSVKWTSPLKIKMSLMDKAMALSNESTPESFRNLIHTKTNKIALMYGKTIIALDGATGKILINENIKAGMLFTDEKEQNLFIVEGNPGLVAELRSFSDGVLIYDFATGKEVQKLKLDGKFGWYKIIDGNIFIKSKEGGMLYNNSGKEVWKNKFGERRILDVEKTSEGYLVSYKMEKMLLDADGKKVWKKAERLELPFEENDYDWLEEEGYTKYKYTNGTIYITQKKLKYFDNKDKKNNFERNLNYQTNLVSYDEKSKGLLVIECGTGSETLFFYNPDKNIVSAKGQPISIKKPGYLNMFEKTANGYFISSPWEYIILDDNGKIIAQKYYSTPGEGGRKLMNFAAGALDTAGAASTVVGMSNVIQGTPDALGNTLGAPGTSTSQMEKGAKQMDRTQYYTEASAMLYNPNRLNSFSQTNDYAFYFTKDKEGNKFLVQVEKNTGKEIDRLLFQNNAPKYTVDDFENRVFYINKNNLDIFNIK